MIQATANFLRVVGPHCCIRCPARFDGPDAATQLQAHLNTAHPNWMNDRMTQAPYSWQVTGSCPVCGSPIYGRMRKPGQSPDMPMPVEALHDPRGSRQLESIFAMPEARRTCPASCLHGMKESPAV